MYHCLMLLIYAAIATGSDLRMDFHYDSQSYRIGVPVEMRVVFFNGSDFTPALCTGHLKFQMSRGVSLNVSTSIIISQAASFFPFTALPLAYSGEVAPKQHITVTATVARVGDQASSSRSIFASTSLYACSFALQWLVPDAVLVGQPFVALLQLLDQHLQLLPAVSESLALSFHPLHAANVTMIYLATGAIMEPSTEFFANVSEARFEVVFHTPGYFALYSHSPVSGIHTRSPIIAVHNESQSNVLAPYALVVLQFGCRIGVNCTIYVNLWNTSIAGLDRVMSCDVHLCFASSDHNSVLPEGPLSYSSLLQRSSCLPALCLQMVFYQYSGDSIANSPILTVILLQSVTQCAFSINTFFTAQHSSHASQVSLLEYPTVSFSLPVHVYAFTWNISQSNPILHAGQVDDLIITGYRDNGTVLTNADERVELWAYGRTLDILKFTPPNTGIGYYTLQPPVSPYASFIECGVDASVEEVEYDDFVYYQIWTTAQNGTLLPPPPIVFDLSLLFMDMATQTYVSVTARPTAKPFGMVANYSGTVMLTTNDTNAIFAPSITFTNSFSTGITFSSPGVYYVTVTDINNLLLTSTVTGVIYCNEVNWSIPVSITAGQPFNFGLQPAHPLPTSINQLVSLSWSSYYGRPAYYNFPELSSPYEYAYTVVLTEFNVTSVMCIVETPGTYQLFVTTINHNLYSPVFEVSPHVIGLSPSLVLVIISLWEAFVISLVFGAYLYFRYQQKSEGKAEHDCQSKQPLDEETKLL